MYNHLVVREDEKHVANQFDWNIQTNNFFRVKKFLGKKFLLIIVFWLKNGLKIRHFFIFGTNSGLKEIWFLLNLSLKNFDLKNLDIGWIWVLIFCL